MAPNVSSAAELLIRHLQQREASGEKRVYLTGEAKAGLRALYLQARSRSQGNAPRAPQTAKPQSPAQPDSLPESKKPTPPDLPVAQARAVLTPAGENRGAQLADLKRRIAEDAEAHLPTLRETMVFSVGNLDADLMIVGEAPGHEEERRGEPFVGPAGQLLGKILQAMGLSREAVYISNIVKYRPAMPNQGTGNRKPTAEEMGACLPYILAETEIVKPRVLVAAGATAAEGLTGRSLAVGRARGQVHQWKGIPFIVTYHPSYLLHNPALSERRKVWEDMLLAMEILQLPISEKQRQFFQAGS